MRELLGVSSSGYYAWIKRRPSQRAEADTMLIAEIRVAHEAWRGTDGAPRIHAELAAKGLRVGCKRIARLMARAGLAGVSREDRHHDGQEWWPPGAGPGGAQLHGGSA